MSDLGYVQWVKRINPFTLDTRMTEIKSPKASIYLGLESHKLPSWLAQPVTEFAYSYLEKIKRLRRYDDYKAMPYIPTPSDMVRLINPISGVEMICSVSSTVKRQLRLYYLLRRLETLEKWSGNPDLLNWTDELYNTIQEQVRDNRHKEWWWDFLPAQGTA